jgi:hypothetical protein
VSRNVRPADGVSLNEAHAALEGGAVGWLAGRSGREGVAIAAAVARRRSADD